jgi:hypothetical protein
LDPDPDLFCQRYGSGDPHLNVTDPQHCLSLVGCFYGLARHSSGSEISILYNVKRVVLKSGQILYCVWITRDSEDTAGKTQVSHRGTGVRKYSESRGFNAVLDLDPACHFNADPDPDPDLHQGDLNSRPLDHWSTLQTLRCA